MRALDTLDYRESQLTDWEHWVNEHAAKPPAGIDHFDVRARSGAWSAWFAGWCAAQGETPAQSERSYQRAQAAFERWWRSQAEVWKSSVASEVHEVRQTQAQVEALMDDAARTIGQRRNRRRWTGP